MLNAETADTSIPVTDVEFSKYGDFRECWTERWNPTIMRSNPTYNPAIPYSSTQSPAQMVAPMAFVLCWFQWRARG